MGHQLRVLQEFSYPHFERGMRKLARVLQSLTHLQLEPAIDAAIDELQGKVIDDQNRRDGQSAENRYRASFQARPRDMPAVVAHQVRELAGEQHQQCEQPRDIDQQDPRQPLVELG